MPRFQAAAGKASSAEVAQFAEKRGCPAVAGQPRRHAIQRARPVGMVSPAVPPGGLYRFQDKSGLTAPW